MKRYGKKVDAILSPNFVEEMLKLAFANKQFAELVVDNLDLSNFPRELGGCKAMLKVLADTMKKRVIWRRLVWWK